MVHLMLGNAEDAFSCGEVVSWFRPVKTHHFSLACVCGEHPCPVWEPIARVPEDTFHRTAFERLQVRFLVDSSKALTWLIDTHRWAADQGIRVYDIFVWKDPIDLAYSFWKRNHDYMFWRTQFVKYYRRVFQAQLPLLAVNYNELTRSPEKKLEEICTALDMPYFAGKERFWEKAHHHLFGSLGVRRQVEFGNSIIAPAGQFPPDFAVLVDNLSKRIAADAEVQQIVAQLKDADVSRAGAPMSNDRRYELIKSNTAWYYMQRLRRTIRRRFPIKSNPHKQETIATIPLRDQ